jgi:hypothetical protein
MKALPSIHEDLASADRQTQLAATRRLADLSAEWGLPIIPELTQDDVSADVLQEAISEQVDFVETRVATIALGGNIKKWKNRNKMVLPIFFHTPIGRETIKRLVFASRFPRHEIALICGLREEQLNAFVRLHGWDKQAIALQRARDQNEWRALVKHKITDAKLKMTEAVLKASDTMANLDGDRILNNLPRLRALNLISDEILPPAIDELGNKIAPIEDGCTVNVGVEIVSHQKKKFDPVEAAKLARATEIENPEPEE